LPSQSEGGGGYTFTEFGHLSDLIKPDEFHDDSYYPTLQKLIDCVVAHEGPIAEGQLVKRIARAHNFQRAGGRIHNRVMDITRDQHYVTEDGGPWYFVWSNRQIANHGVVARFPASDKYIRQIEDIAKAELKAVGSDDPVEIARLFGVRRLSASARTRIEAALAGI
jgi:hypothetical protein